MTSPHAALACFEVLQENAGQYDRTTYAGYAALVSEFVPGVSLQRLLRFATGRGVRLPDVCAMYILERVLTALASAHAVKDAAGNPSPVIHRQVVPTNVIVGWDGTVKLADFGLFKMWQIAWERQAFNGSHQQERTLSPEEAIGTRSDVYNAALLAVRLATGRTPYARFRENVKELLLAIMLATSRFSRRRARISRSRSGRPSTTRSRSTATSASSPPKSCSAPYARTPISLRAKPRSRS